MSDTRDVERRLRADDEYQRRTCEEVGEGRTLSLDAANAIAAERAARERAEAALRPFANAVYNDNGDVTVTPCGIDEYYTAYLVFKKDTTHDR